MIRNARKDETVMENSPWMILRDEPPARAAIAQRSRTLYSLSVGYFIGGSCAPPVISIISPVIHSEAGEAR